MKRADKIKLANEAMAQAAASDDRDPALRAAARQEWGQVRKAAREGNVSFLAVLKRMGQESFGHLSFPMEGYTLALDFPVSPPTLRLLERFDAIVSAHGGRLYLAKDARMPARMLEAGYPRLAAFRDARRRYDLDRRFQSAQAQRLGL